MKGKWRFFLVAGLAVLLAGSLTGCGQYTEDDLYETAAEAENIAYERGYDKGLHDGYETGYDIGYSYGEESGYDVGYEFGYKKGLSDGYEEGYDVGFQVGH